MADLPDLDARIRDLVARAATDAPPAPELGAADVPILETPVDRRRWWMGGGAAVLAAAAAAVVTIVLVGNDGNDRVTTPATVPTTEAPTTTTAQAPTTSVSPPTTVPLAPATPTTLDATTTTTPVPVPTPKVLTAGPAGVVEHTGGASRTLLAEPVAFALDRGDGSVIVQHRRGSGSDEAEPWTDAETVPLVVAGDGSLQPLLPDLDWGGAVVLHDVEVVGDRRLLLYSIVGPVVPQEAYEDLWVVDLDTGEQTLVAAGIGGWEFGTLRLHMAATGLVVGESSSGPTTSPALYAVPGSEAAAAGVPDLTAFGLEDPSDLCDDCPRSFTVSADGSTIGWIAETPGTVFGVGIDQGRVVGDPERRGPAPPGWVSDLELVADGILASFFGDVDGSVEAPVAVAGDGAVTTFEGTVATASPAAAATTDPAPPPGTTIPGPAPVRIATAGPGGVAVIEGGVEVRRLEQPAVLALLTPGGAVIVQPSVGGVDGNFGDPLIWRPDGTVESLLGPLGERQWYRLHDVASIDGVPTVLYGVRTDGVLAGADTAIEDFTEVLYALSMRPGAWSTTQVDETFTWEGGFSRLSLSDQGAVVGASYSSSEVGYYATVVPGSPAAGGHGAPPDAATLGIEPNVSECNRCPDHFAISADGESVSWIDGGTIVDFDTASGRTRAWTVPSLGARSADSLDVRTSSNGGIEAAISWGNDPGTDPAAGPSPVVAATSMPGEVVETETGGRVATFGPES